MKKLPSRTHTFLSALGAFFGTTVGVGIFALPFTFVTAFPTSIFILIGTALILTSLYTMYIDIILTKGIGVHQLPGIVSKIWGKKSRNIVGGVLLLGRTGIMFLYLVIFADFSEIICNSVLGISIPLWVYPSILVLTVAFILKSNVKAFTKVQLLLSLIIVTLIGGVSASVMAVNSREVVNFMGSLVQNDQFFNARASGVSFTETMAQFGLIYGVCIGALSGIAAIPSLKEISKDKEVLLKATRVGIFLVGILYTLFAFFVVSRSAVVSGDALHGLGDHWWVVLLAVGGLISVTTSFIGVGFGMYEMYEHDYKLPGIVPILLAILPPYVFYLLDVGNFTKVAAIIGGVIGGTEGLIILASYWKLEEKDGVFPVSRKVLAICTAVVLTIGFVLAL